LVEDDGEFSGNGDDRLSMATRFSELHPPGFERRPARRSCEHGVGSGIECASHVGVAALGDMSVDVQLAGLEASWCEAEVSGNGA
jgi:hypothetical protein